MKKLLFLAAVLCALQTIAQNKKRFLYYLNNNLESVSQAEATILGKGVIEKGLLKLDCYTVSDNMLLLTAHFTDSSLTVLEGPYTQFHTNGDTAQIGIYAANYKESIWQKWDSLGYKMDSIYYKADKAIFKREWEYDDKGKINYRKTIDSLADTYQAIYYDEDGKIDYQVDFKGDKGTLVTYGEKGITKESVFTRVEREAEFPGGLDGWRIYLEDNLNPDVPVNLKAPVGTYRVEVRFIVNEDGSISDIRAMTNHGYGMEREVVRILKKGPKWIPAVQYGRNIKAYRMQPVTFVVEEK